MRRPLPILRDQLTSSDPFGPFVPPMAGCWVRYRYCEPVQCALLQSQCRWGWNLPTTATGVMREAFGPVVLVFLYASSESFFDVAFAVSDEQNMDVPDHTSRYSVPTFTYAGPPGGPDYEAWREEFCRRFCQLDAETVTAERIECTVEISQVASLSFGTAYGSSGSFLRTRSLISDGHDDLILLTAVRGDALAVQRGRSIELRPSEMCLTSLDHIGESRLSEGGRYTALRMPRRDLMRCPKISRTR
jgi:hypothetical protein